VKEDILRMPESDDLTDDSIDNTQFSQLNIYNQIISIPDVPEEHLAAFLPNEALMIQKENEPARLLLDTCFDDYLNIIPEKPRI
jgi:hypothetical protein